MTRRAAPPIYATPTGKRYHGSIYCNGLNSYAVSTLSRPDMTPPTVTRAEARQRNLTPCNVCRPAPFLAVLR